MKMQLNRILVLALVYLTNISGIATADTNQLAAVNPATNSESQNSTLSKDKKTDMYEHRHEVATGIQKALNECRQKFKWDRWNCPRDAFHDILGREPVPSNKEFGLSRAFIASGIVLSLIRSCSRGAGNFCGCNQPPDDFQGREVPVNNDNKMNRFVAANYESQDRMSPRSIRHHSKQNLPSDINKPTIIIDKNGRQIIKFSWAGCEETVKFSFKVAKAYLESHETPGRMANEQKVAHLINAHNYEVGRQAVRRNIHKKCKCHGTSGSCHVKTCWPVLPDLSEVGTYLKRQYGIAAKVGAMSAADTNVGGLKKELAAINSTQLVFVDASPDYCFENSKLGINGTLGRFCSNANHKTDNSYATRYERDSCDRLCTKCGYKIQREVLTIEKQCDCKFFYCCTVECKRCAHSEETFKCVRHS